MTHRFFSATRHGIPLLALAMLGFGGWSVASKYRPRVVTSPPIAAPTSPYGDVVKAGQPLFSIDDRNYRATVAQDEATVASATASVAAIDQSLILQDAAIEQARANLEGAEAERNRAALDFTRYAHLVQDSWATRQRF